MYAVLQRHPTVRDAKISRHNGYTHEYGINDSSLVKYLELRDNFAYPGVPLAVKDVARIKKSMKVGEGERPLEFFEETLGRASMIVKMTAAHQTGRGRMMCRRSLRQEAGEPGESPSAAWLTAAVGHAASRQLSGRSKYTVPHRSTKLMA